MGDINDKRAEAKDSDSRMMQGLVERIRRGSCILVLGPGVAIDPQDETHTPLTRRLSRKLAQDELVCQYPLKLDPEDLRQVSQVFYKTREDRIQLEIAVAEFYAEYEGATTDFHRALAELPFRLCICTTPDKLMFNALKEQKAGARMKTPYLANYNFRGTAENNVAAPSEDSPVVYHLYGSVDDPDSLVLTESDLIDFLVNVVRGTPPLPPMIEGAMSNKETTFLFIGFGFLNWYVRVLLQVLNVYGHRNRPVAMEDPSFFANPDHKHNVIFFSDERSIEFRQLNWRDFARRLRDSYLARKPDPALPAHQAAGAPKAFLCYANDDAASVVQLREQLEVRGIATWRDKDNLKAGDNWNRVLVHVIEKQVDYVVVCQSKAMDARLSGYYHKEIEIALEQQRRFRPGARFVLATKLDDCVGHPDLQHLHFESVRSDEGVNRLVMAIQGDWQARKSAVVT